MDARPYVRWWWLSGPFTETDMARQLHWIESAGFGGVELAWIDPTWLEEPERSAPRPAFLSDEWTKLVSFAKREATALGLRCDFTFGSAWPFGGSWLKEPDASWTFEGPSEQRLHGSWEGPANEKLYVLNHLSAEALRHYSEPLLKALRPALRGARSALFCDSLEVATERLWSRELTREFQDEVGYDLRPYLPRLDQELQVRYDYRKFRGKVLCREFYSAFSALCQAQKADSRVQCHGASTDLLAAYATVDIPESEALLFPPAFSRIAASAAAWAGKPVVSAEAFTCLHGFPGWDDSAEELWRKETPGDLKLLADALFANGVNLLVWHGMPYQPAGQAREFYAAVHVGPDSSFARSLPSLNEYFAQACELLREGQVYGSMGVYLPYEDALLLDSIPDDERTPGANYRWEMRHARQPAEVAGYAPVWISAPFLEAAECSNKKICSGGLKLDALYIDCDWLDVESVMHLARLAQAGAAILWTKRPHEPGLKKASSYQRLLSEAMANYRDIPNVRPLLQGNVPTYTARQTGDDLLLFFAHPAAEQIQYPMKHRLSQSAVRTEREASIYWAGRETRIPLHFGANDPVAVRISVAGAIGYEALAPAADLGA